MNNQLTKERARYLYTIWGQPYRAARPATPGYWRTVQGSPQTVWTKVIRVTWHDYPIRGAWTIGLYWTDPFTNKNTEWYGTAAESQPINIPYLLRYYGGREEIQVYGPARTERVWVPGTPYEPEQPYIPDQHIYEDNTGWNAGARSIAEIGQGAAASWKVSPMARGVAVGLSPNAAAGAYWQYPVGVLATNGAAKVIAAGAEVQSLGIFTANTVFRIERLDGDVNVYVDDALRYTTPDTTPAPLLLDVSLYASGDSVHDPAISSVGSGVAHGTLPGLQGLAADEIEDGTVILYAPPLIFSIIAEQGGDGEAHGTLAGLYGIAADSDSYSFTSGALPGLQGEARGFLDLPPLENPTYIHAVMPSVSAKDVPASTGVQSARMAWLVGMVSDDDVALAYGALSLGSIFAEGENPDEDTLSIRQRPITTMRGQSVQEARLREQLSVLMALGASHISLVPMATHVRATEGMASSSTTSAGVHGSGINASIEAQIWARDRDRIQQEYAATERDTIGTFAARGFPMPPGAAMAVVQRARADAAAKTSAASRDLAIKQMDLEIENVRFAVDKAIGLYSAATDAARGYMTALAGTSGNVTQLLPSVTDSQSRLISAASGFYQSRIAAQELRLKATMPSHEWEQQAKVRNLDAQTAAANAKVQAAIEAAKALSNQAAAMLNALHVQSSTGATGGHSVNYSYGGEVTSPVPPHTV